MLINLINNDKNILSELKKRKNKEIEYINSNSIQKTENIWYSKYSKENEKDEKFY